MLKIISYIYFALLFYLVFLLDYRLNQHFRSSYNTFPFKKTYEFITHYSELQLLDKWCYYSDLIGNVVLFIPFPFTYQQLSNQTYTAKKIVIIVLIASVFIEAMQYLLNIGVLDIDDLLLNSLGGWIGIQFTKKLTS